jgi:hypothetical protein
MSKNALYVIVAVLLVIIIGGGAYYLGSRGGQKEGVANTPAANAPAVSEANKTLSEQPNTAKFNEYFKSIYLGKLPVGAKFDPFKVTRATVFSAGEQFCTSMEIKKEIPAGSIAGAVYDVVAKTDIRPRSAFPQKLATGGSMGCESLEYPTGKYEDKIYIDDVLVAVLPFEVK